MIGWIILFIGMGILLWLLLLPVTFYLDTTARRYSIDLWKLLYIRVIFSEDKIFYLHIRLFFVPFRLYPLKWIMKADKKKKKQKPEKKNGKKKQKGEKRNKPISFSKAWRIMMALFHAVRIRRLLLILDTGDYAVNADLIPVFGYLSGHRQHIRLEINFNDRNNAIVQVEFRAIRFIIHYIATRINK